MRTPVLLLGFSLLCPILCLSCQSPEPKQASALDGVQLSTTALLERGGYQRLLEQFFASGREGSFPGRDEVPIHYRIFLQEGREKGAILISSGRTESLLRYKEVIYDLYRQGYSVYIHDHRGQGLSGRMASDPEMGHVADFQYYVDDMKHFYEHYLLEDGHANIFLLAHSMGGAVGMAYLEQHPGDFDAASFSSPMLGLEAYICPLSAILPKKPPRYGPGQGGYSEDSTSFAGNAVTSSEIRFMRNLAVLEAHPEARLGGPTTAWIQACCKGMKSIRRNADALETPFLLFSAEDESVVNPRAHRRFMALITRLEKDAIFYQVKDARHELMMEADPARSAFLSTSLVFFESRAILP